MESKYIRSTLHKLNAGGLITVSNNSEFGHPFVNVYMVQIKVNT